MDSTLLVFMLPMSSVTAWNTLYHHSHSWVFCLLMDTPMTGTSLILN